MYLLPLVTALLLCAWLVARLRAGVDREHGLARLDQLTGVPNVRAFYELAAVEIVARVGGDEFVVLLPETGTAPARLAIDKLRHAVSGIVPAHGWRLSASIGVATYLVAPESVDVLVGTADQLMSAAKRSGKNTVSHETQNDPVVLRS